jgi:acetyltransferase-like isoleucine patch superfamily enzyme
MDKYNIPFVKTFEFTKIIGLENIDFGKYIIIDDFTLIYAKKKISIGNYVHIASFTSISGGGEFVMEDFSGLSSGCRIITGTDDFKGRGFGNPTIAGEFRNVHIGTIKIEKFAIVGTNSVILPDVTIGEGATIAAGSVISKDLESWGIYIGHRKIGTRNKEEVLKNYENFMSESENEKIGDLFK